MSPFELLQRLCADLRTGVLFATTSDGRLIRIGIGDGSVLHVGYGPRQGRAALDQLELTSARSASFSEGATIAADADLPAQDNLMKRLSVVLQGSGAGTLVAVPEQVSPAPQVVPAPPRTNTRAPLPITAERLAALKAVMVEMVGPMGEILVDEAVEKGANSVASLVNALSRDLGSPDEIRHFHAAVSKFLR